MQLFRQSRSFQMFATFRFISALVIMAVCRKTAAVVDIPSASTPSGRGLFSDSGLTRTVHHILNHCLNQEDALWCFKIQGAKMMGRALKFQNLNIIEGVALVRKNDTETRNARSNAVDINLSNRDLDNLSAKSLDALLLDRFALFVQSRQLQVNMPRLLTFGKNNGQEFLNSIRSFFNTATSAGQYIADEYAGDEGRKKKDDKKYLGPFIAAVMLKAAILKMAYHSIAIVAGKALIVGKIALIISAIIGLKKLVSNDGGEKTTYEIVKHPQVQQSHTYSSSHQNEYEGGHEGGSYHRSMDDEMMMQDKAYNAWVPTNA